MQQFNKTRIAPTPSGYLHLGNAASFLLTAQLAERSGAQILLRVDDLDSERIRPEYVQDIFDTLQFLNINWQQGPRNYEEYQTQYSQHHRLSLYYNAITQLADAGHLFACTCSRSQVLAQSPDGAYPGTCRHKGLPLNTPGSCLRLYTDNTPITIQTLNGPETYTLPADMKDFVVRKKDGCPAYQLASVVDDLHFGVDLVVRGNDLRASTIAQVYLSQKLPSNSFHLTSFHHHPLFIGSDGQKLSKSAGSTSIQALRKQGKSRDEVLQMINGNSAFKA